MWIQMGFLLWSPIIIPGLVLHEHTELARASCSQHPIEAHVSS